MQYFITRDSYFGEETKKMALTHSQSNKEVKERKIMTRLCETLLYSRTPDWNFRCFYPCEIILGTGSLDDVKTHHTHTFSSSKLLTRVTVADKLVLVNPFLMK